ncbi:TPA: divalent-cation tolerance protein CutA [archaeon]|uniref:Divalent-cation tolerance protein CutA n=1 Tax=Candidatus Undinarchaeum marinum TaxID=2756141 RepID=A0A832UTR5_9ARCH|nr:divalent-cation tolerance protein CutA [Candidatus Undinarchaeum marinum]
MIYTTTRNKEDAKKIGKTLVEEGLAFCVNIIPNCSSIYFWKGKMEESDEAVLIIKTQENFEGVQKRIDELHNYEVPEILKINIDDLNKKYLDWSSQP